MTIAPSRIAGGTHSDSSAAGSAVALPTGARLTSALHAAMTATAVAGIVVALAPVVPAPIRDPLVVAALAAWVVTAGIACVAVLRTAWSDLAGRRHRDAALDGIALAGTLIAIGLAVQLELIRVLERRPAFTWIVDWRWAMNHAWAIARSGNVYHSLDYSGVGLDYHVGPAWFAASVQRIFGAGLPHVLFGVVPLLCVVTMVIGGALVLRSARVPGRLAAVAVVVAMAWPVPAWPPTWVLHELRSTLVAPFSWQFLATDLMLNSLFAIPVALAALALLLDRRATTWRLAVGSAALASCIELKPQYFMGFGLVAGLLVMWRLTEPRDRARNIRALLAVLSSLALAVAARATLPGDVALFDAPHLGPLPSAVLSTEIRRTYTLLALVALAGWLLARRYSRDDAKRTPVALLVVSLAACVGLTLVLQSTVIPVKAAFVQQGHAIGLREITPTYLRRDLLQGVEPVRFVLLFAAVGLLGVVSALIGSRLRALYVSCCAIAVLVPLPVFAAGFSSTPPTQYGAVEDTGLLTVLGAIPLRGSVLISSDIADPANDYSRPVRAPLLTAYRGHQFYVSNLRYVNYVRPDALQRLAGLREFFGAHWSPWQDAWLARNGIDFILVDRRCSPAWLQDPKLPLTVRARSGDWTAFHVERSADRNALVASSEPAGWHDLVPAFGRADCLLGHLRD